MGPNDCWWAALLITVQSMVGLLMDSVIIGIIFARISHPKYRGRTIAISDSAVISRRDGVLKFMFRVADFRRSQVCRISQLPAHLHKGAALGFPSEPRAIIFVAGCNNLRWSQVDEYFCTGKVVQKSRVYCD